MNAFLGILILLVPLIIEIKNPKKSKGYIVFLAISCMVLFLLGVDKIKRDNIKDDLATQRHNSVVSTLHVIAEKSKVDSVQFAQYEKRLVEKYP